jgi:hypothetical protein
MNYVILPESLVVNYDGETYTIAKTDCRFKKAIAAIKAGDIDAVKEIVEHEGLLGGDLELKDDVLYYKGDKLPKSLADRVLQFLKDDLPFDSLIKFFEKLHKNPSYNSREMLYKFLEHNGHPITPEGNFIAYRGVTGDFKDCHTRTFDNSVGSVCEMAREDVDDNPNNTCSSGLHIARHSYAKSFGSQLVEVEVNPTDVVCVPTDYDGTKCRVSKFKVINVCGNIREETLYNQEKNSEGNSLISRAVRVGEWYGNITDYDDFDDQYRVLYENSGGDYDWYSREDFELI